MTSPAADLRARVDQHLGWVRAAAERGEPDWLAVLQRYQLQRDPGGLRAELAAALRVLVQWARGQLAALPGAAQGAPDAVELRLQLDGLELAELQRFDAEHQAAQPLAAAPATGGIGSIFQNAASTGAKAQAAWANQERAVRLICPACGAAQEQRGQFSCPYCGQPIQ